MKLTRSQVSLTAVAALMFLAALPISAQEPDSGNQLYEVTVINLTAGQIISAPIVYSHRGRFELFTPGEAAIPELASLAEDAAGDDLVALLIAEPLVADVAVAGDGVIPGDSMTVEIEVPYGYRYVSALGMLVTTNDAFVSATSKVPANGKAFYGLAWDAGSEANTQDCDHIPGPPCGSGGIRVEDGAEGFVYIHTGIQARGDLDPAMHDWRNPVAKIEIRRVSH